MFSLTFDSSTVSLVNSTLSGNEAALGSGGVYSYTSSGSTVALHRSLIAGNATYRGADEIQWLGNGGHFLVDDYNLFGHSGISTAEALDGFTPGPSDLLLTSDSSPPTPLAEILSPLLADNGGPTFTHALVPGSPAIDLAGACELATDQRGFLRADGHCDTGAYEFGARPSPCEDTPPTFGCTVNEFINQFCVGTPGKDIILGTDGDDVIFGGAGDDKVQGKGGDDVVCGEAGNDILQGKAGDNVLDGGSGNDQLVGGFGEDALAGGNGNDRLLGGPGDDDLVGGEDTDVLKGDGGTDTCDGEKESNCEL